MVRHDRVSRGPRVDAELRVVDFNGFIVAEVRFLRKRLDRRPLGWAFDHTLMPSQHVLVLDLLGSLTRLAPGAAPSTVFS